MKQATKTIIRALIVAFLAETAASVLGVDIDPETGNDREIGYAVEKVLVPFEE